MSCSTFSNGFVREAYSAIGTGGSGVILTLARPAFHSDSARDAQNSQRATTAIASHTRRIQPRACSENGWRGRPARPARPGRRLNPFGVEQISNLPYRRFVIGRRLLGAGGRQVKNPRYSAGSGILKGCEKLAGG